MLRLAIIVGSTRPGRVGEAVARWVHGVVGGLGVLVLWPKSAANDE